MTFFKQYYNTLIFLFVIGMVGYKQIPLWMHSKAQVGADVVAFEVQNLQGEYRMEPTTDVAKVYIFWATWCGPCHLQLSQFDKAVRSGSLSADDVVAVSLDKSIEDLKSFMKEKDYDFKVALATSKTSWADLNVKATPSIAFVKNKRVVNFFTGLSPLSTYRANSFLKD